RPSGSSAFAVRNQLRPWRSGSGGGPDSALQTDLPPSGDENGSHRVVFAETGGGRKWQRHAHECFRQPERHEFVLGSKGRRKAEQNGLGFRGSRADPRKRHLPSAECKRQCLSPAGPAFRSAEWTNTLFAAEVKARYVDLKRSAADRCPRALGTFVKAPEVQYHHEVYNQFLWNLF